VLFVRARARLQYLNSLEPRVTQQEQESFQGRNKRKGCHSRLRASLSSIFRLIDERETATDFARPFPGPPFEAAVQFGSHLGFNKTNPVRHCAGVAESRNQIADVVELQNQNDVKDAESAVQILDIPFDKSQVFEFVDC
jgi:hypothetical protein